MNSPESPPPRKLGANRNEPARKSRRAARSFSESCDLHEDRGTVQSKFSRSESTTLPTRARPRRAEPRTRAGLKAVPTRLLPEHSSGPDLRLVSLHFGQNGAQQVSVAGSFNDWNPKQTPLERNGMGDWEIALSLAPGDYEYRFIVDGEWVDDPAACAQVPNPFGSQNAVIHVGN